MKKLVFLLLLFITSLSFGQAIDTSRWIKNDGSFNYNNWKVRGNLVIPTKTDTTSKISGLTQIIGTDLYFVATDHKWKTYISDTSGIHTQLANQLAAIQANSASIGAKLNAADTANIRLRANAGTNMTITGTYPNLTFNSTGGNTGWALGGNASTNPPNDYIGTSDNHSLTFRTSAVPRIKIDSTGEVRSLSNLIINKPTGSDGSRLQVNGAITYKYSFGSGTTTLGDNDYIFEGFNSSFIVNLPPAANMIGRMYIIKNGQSASGQATTMTITPNGSETINYAPTYTLANGDYVSLFSDSLRWVVVASSTASSSTGGGTTTTGTTSYQAQTASGSTSFTFSSVPSTLDDYIVFVNGMAIRPTTDYTTSGNVITIPTILTGDVVRFQRIK